MVQDTSKQSGTRESVEFEYIKTQGLIEEINSRWVQSCECNQESDSRCVEWEVEKSPCDCQGDCDEAGWDINGQLRQSIYSGD